MVQRHNVTLPSTSETLLAHSHISDLKGCVFILDLSLRAMVIQTKLFTMLTVQWLLEGRLINSTRCSLCF